MSTWSLSYKYWYKQEISETSLVLQWLRIHLSEQGTSVQALAGELRSHMSWGNKATCHKEEPMSCSEDPVEPK